MTIIKLKSEFVICSKREVFSDFNTPEPVDFAITVVEVMT